MQDASPAPPAPLGNRHVENRHHKKDKIRAKLCNVSNLMNLTIICC